MIRNMLPTLPEDLFDEVVLYEQYMHDSVKRVRHRQPTQRPSGHRLPSASTGRRSGRRGGQAVIGDVVRFDKDGELAHDLAADLETAVLFVAYAR